jgi:hypothetical protein
MTTYICANCAKEFESAELEAYVQRRKDDDWPLSLEDIARFVCSEWCSGLMDEKERAQENEDEQEN